MDRQQVSITDGTSCVPFDRSDAALGRVTVYHRVSGIGQHAETRAISRYSERSHCILQRTRDIDCARGGRIFKPEFDVRINSRQRHPVELFEGHTELI